MATSYSFTAVGSGTAELVPSGSTINYSLSGTFSATLQLVYSTTGGNTWNLITQKTAAASGDYILETKDGSPALVMWRCIAFTSGTAVTSIVQADNEVFETAQDVVDVLNDTGLTQAQSIAAINGVPAIGNDGTSYTYNADGTLLSYVNNAGWALTFAYSGGKVSTITYTKSGETTRVQTYTWGNFGPTSIVTA